MFWHEAVRFDRTFNVRTQEAIAVLRAISCTTVKQQSIGPYL